MNADELEKEKERLINQYTSFIYDNPEKDLQSREDYCSGFDSAVSLIREKEVKPLIEVIDKLNRHLEGKLGELEDKK